MHFKFLQTARFIRHRVRANQLSFYYLICDSNRLCSTDVNGIYLRSMNIFVRLDITSVEKNVEKKLKNWLDMDINVLFFIKLFYLYVALLQCSYCTDT